MSFTSGPYAAHARAVLSEKDKFVKTNTAQAYNHKVAEFLGFCLSLYPVTSPGDNATTVNEEKLFGFLFYTSRRPTRTRGRPSSNACRLKPGVFDRNEYDRIMEVNVTPSAYLVGYDVLNQTYSGIVKLWKRQCDLGANNATKDQLRSERVLSLMDLVKKRKKRYIPLCLLRFWLTLYLPVARLLTGATHRLSRQGFKEKLKCGLSPYLLVEKIPVIEEWLWEHNALLPIFSLASIRDRFVFLLSTHAILRGESLFLSDLSDYCDLVVENAGCSECHVLVLQVDTGKTNGLKTLYGRVVRHKHVELCPIGALGLMLLGRFEHTSEVEKSYDFLNNQSWFNVKALIDYKKNNLNVAVSDQSYAKAIKSCCAHLEINSCHFVHIGRAVGPIIAEIAEVEGDAIANLGNWNTTVREDRYSAKLPMKIMRVMAGHSDLKNTFYLPRADVKPSALLQSQIFPFIEMEQRKIASSKLLHPTASAFLLLLKRLRSIILQDVALLLQQGRKHSLFHLPVFATPEFLEFQKQIAVSILDSAINDPATASVRTVLPGICERLDNLHNQQTQDTAQICENIQVTNQYLQLAIPTKDDLTKFVTHLGKFQFGSQNIYNTTANLNADTDAMVETGKITVSDTSEHHAALYKLKPYHSMTEMWIEWFGCIDHHFNTPANCQPGIASREKTMASKWRSHFTPAEAKQFSRMKQIVAFISVAIENDKTQDAATILKAHDALFRTCKYSLYNMVKVLKTNNQHRSSPFN